MQSKICLITRANAGIGKATALGLARLGATIVMVSRNQAKGEEARKEIQAQSGNDNVHLLLADLSSQQSIRQLVQDFQQQFSQLHVLINNAGGFYASRSETADGLETTFAVNYLAPFLLTNLLLDTLKVSAPARIVNVSSMAHAFGRFNVEDLQSRQRYGGMQVYGQSKLALILFTYELARRLEGTGVTANVLHPGFVASNFGKNNSSSLMDRLFSLATIFAVNTEEGAKTSVYLASSPAVEGVTGKYFVKSASKKSAAVSYDEELQQRLWEESVKLVHLT